jgi:hypothetical protein
MAPRYQAQVVMMMEPAMKEALTDLAERSGLTMSAITRLCIIHGMAAVQRRLGIDDAIVYEPIPSPLSGLAGFDG